MASVEPSISHEYVYYKGGDGTSNWEKRTATVAKIPYGSDPAGSAISEVYDGTKGHDVLQTSSPNGTNGMDNSYQLLAYPQSAGGTCETVPNNKNDWAQGRCWKNNQQEKLTFQIKTPYAGAPVEIYVHLSTSETNLNTGYNQYNAGLRILKYTLDDVNSGGAEVAWGNPEMDFYGYAYYNATGNWPHNYPALFGGKTLHYGLGSGLNDGNWQTIERDLKEDLEDLQSDNHLLKVQKVEIRGNARIDKISLDFTDEEFERMDKFQKDPEWAYDTGWLDMHEFGDNPAGTVMCNPDGDSGWHGDACELATPEYKPCDMIISDVDTKIDFDASNLPSAVMNDCHLTMNNDYSVGSAEGVQQEETILLTINTGSEEKTLLFPDPGQGRTQVTSSEPFTLRRGINSFYFRNPGFCGVGESVHFGRDTGYVYLAVSKARANRIALDAMRIKCGAGSDALDLVMHAESPIPYDTKSLISWTSTNAKSCVPWAGFFDGIDNDWQNMTPTWTDLTLLPDSSANTSWPTYSTFSGNATFPITKPFETNQLKQNTNYSLTCKNTANTQSVTKTASVSVLPSGYNVDGCQDFGWDRVSSYNDPYGNPYNDDPAGHPAIIDSLDAVGNPSPVAGNNVHFDPVYNLSAGNHSIYIKMREIDGAISDKLIVTDDLAFDPGADPTDPLGEKAVAGGKNKIEIETESCTRAETNYTKLISNYTASGNSAVKFTFWEYANNYSSDFDSMYVKCDFNVTTAGNYVVWGRNGVAEGQGTNANSFWFGMDNADPTVRNDFIFWEFGGNLNDPNPVAAHCLSFDFWVGQDADKANHPANESVTIDTDDTFTLRWATGNIQQVIASMDLSGTNLPDPAWTTPSTKDATETPAPPYHFQTIGPLATTGTYIYQLHGIYNTTAQTATKEVRVTVNSSSPTPTPTPNFSGVCGHVCLENHCTLPATGLCTFPSTLDTTDPAYAPTGIKETITGWEWECKGSGTGADSLCTATKDCGWKER